MKKYNPHQTIFKFFILFIFITFSFSKVIAQTKTEKNVRINMNNADIRAVIQWVSEKTNKNFIIDPRVKGRINVLSNQPMSMDEAYQVFLTALDVYGFAAVESGNNVKFLPNSQARSSGLPVITNFNNPDDDNSELIIHVIEVKNLIASDVVSTIRPLVPQAGHLAAFPNSNSIVIADRANNINRISELIKYIDTTGDIDIEIIEIEFATAEDIIKVIEPLLSDKNSTIESSVTFAFDKRSNSIIMAGNKEKRSTVKDLISSLDKPLQGKGNTKVIFLNYIEANEIKPILSSMTGSIQDESKDSLVSRADVNIQASETTNALIVTAPPSIIEVIESVIRELDIKRSQVMIEAVIVEVSESFTNKLEILWQTSDSAMQPTASGSIAVSNFNSNSSSLLESGLNLGYFRNGDLRGLLNAIKTDNFNNILSTPSIITIENEEAEILVGSTVPFVTGSQALSSSQSSTGITPYRTIQREDVGITLKITPKVSKSGSITLDINQEVESVRQEDLPEGAQGLITDKRSIKTNVLVDDGQIIVLGGLIDGRKSVTESKIPLLGDIPILGKLFKGTSESIIKQNMMVFIKPSIINDHEVIKKKSKESFEKIKQSDNNNDITLPELNFDNVN